MSTHAEHPSEAPARQHAGAQYGLSLFAGILMVVGGLYHALIGLGAIFRDQIYVVAPNYTYTFDLTAWGWTHLLLGALVVAAGVAVVEGATWGRIVGIGLAILSMLANFLFIPHYPVWSILIIALDVAVIWALASSTRNA